MNTVPALADTEPVELDSSVGAMSDVQLEMIAGGTAIVNTI